MKKKSKLEIWFEPDNGLSIACGLAQAVCMARGGAEVVYEDPNDHKKRTLAEDDLPLWKQLETQNPKHPVTRVFCAREITAGSVVAVAQLFPVKIHVNLNEVDVVVEAKTTVEQAVDQYRQKLEQKNQKLEQQIKTVSHKSPRKPRDQHTKA